MIQYESSVEIARSPETVFSYLVEPDKQALWSDVPMRPLTAGPMATGSRIEVTSGRGPISATLGLDMTEVRAPERMAFRSFSGPIRWEGAYELEPAALGTRLSQHGTLQFTGLWRLIEPIVGAEIRSGEIKELEKLKAAAERG